MGALEIRPKAPYSFVRAVSPSQVFEAAVVVEAGEHWARPPVLLLISKKSCPIQQEAIDHCRANMAHFKVPRIVIFGELSMTSAGEV